MGKRLSDLIEKVMTGQEVIIGKAGRPFAKIVRYERSEKPRQTGALRGKIKTNDDFDDLPNNIANGQNLVFISDAVNGESQKINPISAHSQILETKGVSSSKMSNFFVEEGRTRVYGEAY